MGYGCEEESGVMLMKSGRSANGSGGAIGDLRGGGEKHVGIGSGSAGLVEDGGGGGRVSSGSGVNSGITSGSIGNGGGLSSLSSSGTGGKKKLAKQASRCLNTYTMQAVVHKVQTT
jgi:hypothetical protein